MRLSDVISNAADLSLYPKVGLVLFVLVFVTILVRTLRRPSAQTDRWGLLPLNDDDTGAGAAGGVGGVVGGDDRRSE